MMEQSVYTYRVRRITGSAVISQHGCLALPCLKKKRTIIYAVLIDCSVRFMQGLFCYFSSDDRMHMRKTINIDNLTASDHNFQAQRSFD